MYLVFTCRPGERVSARKLTSSLLCNVWMTSFWALINSLVWWLSFLTAWTNLEPCVPAWRGAAPGEPQDARGRGDAGDEPQRMRERLQSDVMRRQQGPPLPHGRGLRRRQQRRQQQRPRQSRQQVGWLRGAAESGQSEGELKGRGSNT